jgi:hypothetical protein
MGVKSVTYRIDNLELRLPDKEHCSCSEIVRYVSNRLAQDGEFCYTVATFEYDRDGYPELTFCGNRPLELTSEEFEKFMILVRDGYKYKKEYDGEYTER